MCRQDPYNIAKLDNFVPFNEVSHLKERYVSQLLGYHIHAAPVRVRRCRGHAGHPEIQLFPQLFLVFCVFFFVVIPGLNELGIQSSPHPLALVVLRLTSKIII
jgi:hypothetical protein